MKPLFKRSPFGTNQLLDTDSFFSQMNSAMHDFFDDRINGTDEGDDSSVSLFEKVAYPKLDIREESNQFIIDVEIPGLVKEDIKVEVIDNVLIVRGEKRKNVEENKATYLRRELKRSSFSRQVCRFSEGYCDSDKIDATFKDGFLTIVVPKKKVEPVKSNARSIEIK